MLDLGLRRAARRGRRDAHRVGRRHRPGAARRLPARCASPSATATTTATSSSTPVGPALGRPRARRRRRCARRPWTRGGLRADPRHRHRHRAGRLRHRRPRGRAGARSQSARGRRHAEIAHARPSSSSAARPASSCREISVVAVDLGPGLFTGLRVGVAAAKAMAHALRVPMIGVASLDLLAFPVRFTPAADRRRHRRPPGRAVLRLLPPGARRRAAPQRPPGRHRPTTWPPSSWPRARSACSSATARSATARSFDGLDKVEIADDGLAYPSASSLVQLAHAQALREEFVKPWDLAAALPPQARRRDQLVDPGRPA